MNRTQEAYNSMAHKTIGETKRHNNIWKDNKVFVNTVTKIDGLFVEIEETNARQNKKTEGLTGQKNKYRKQLDTTTDVFLGIFRSYAKITGNDELYANSDKSITEIKRIKDTEIMVLVNTTIKYATSHLKDLKDYGITEAMISDYQKSANGFVEFLTKPQEIIAERKTATSHLKELFKQLDEQLTEYLDNLMMQYKLKEPQFYSDYENARIIYDDPTISKSLMGTVTDAHEPAHVLQYVKVTVKFKAGSELADNVKKTTAKGNFQFKKLPEGVCTVTFEKNKYETQTIETEIHKNALTRINVQLKKKEEL